MALRNFWVEVEIDGRKTKICGGPRSRDGMMTVKVFQRENGTSYESARVVCEQDCYHEDLLKTHVYSRTPDGDWGDVKLVQTSR